MRDKPWAVVPLLNTNGAIIWYPKEMDALLDQNGSAPRDPNEEYSYPQYRPGRKAKVRK